MVSPIWTGGGGMPLRVFAKFFINGLTDLCQTL